MTRFSALDDPTPYLFFTGKGGVGKTSLSCASAIALADRGLKVLLVSTDPASNLDEMLGVALTDDPTPVPGIPGLSAMNIDPEAAAEDYRTRVLAQLGPEADAAERSTVREQLSGACTTEIAAFDEFVGLLAGDAPAFDHIIFDTAPTGHTLRLLSLPKAWTGFLETNERGASCLGPHSGLKMQEDRFRQALECLGDPARTTIVLVTRADRGAIREAARTSAELSALGLSNQMLAVNGRFRAASEADAVASAMAREQEETLASMPETLAGLPRAEFPLLGFDMVGLPALRALMTPGAPHPAAAGPAEEPLDLPGLADLVDEIAAGGRGLVMVMGKGGVGKTTVAAAIAVGLAARGQAVHLTTTDPAAHVSFVVDGVMPGLTVDRIDPAAETKRYIDKIMASRGRDLDAEGKALLLEDLASPCTEEVAVFHAFSRVVAEARSAFVVLDTAPTGHTLLLLDATGAYHRQMTRHLEPGAPGRVVTPLMRLQDADYTRVLLVVLPETTPVSEAGALQDDLRRAGIEPYGWVVNKSMAATGTSDPLLGSRLAGERAQIDRVRTEFARRTYLLGYRTTPPVGLSELEKLTQR
ncbi:arsenical pump-driving ATPase [Hoeflea sp.]|uniref:arsenical pump-driving ATPase n=1 Tax=Hoeflea sp. TaxID=1940281 RepID=UPI0019C04FDF|nr:arsenical pump-driving ATPase [Hoeflea sp.]MBC7282508.1 arsenical pump-driving ATPase [Hoeflea sp.]